MVSIKGHFDGKTVVLDEPAELRAGQSVRIVIDEAVDPQPRPRKARFGFAKGKISMSRDFKEPLDDFADYR